MSLIDKINEIQNPTKLPTFVHRNIEVRKTGRRASKTVGNKVITLHEIVPFDNSMPQVADWVQEGELFVVE